MNVLLIILTIVALLGLPAILYFERRSRKKSVVAIPENYRQLLRDQVNFYQQLSAKDQVIFENRMQVFLNQVTITGIRTAVEDLDRVLIAAGAIIPIFGFPNWEYMNLREVLLYPDAFSEGFAQDGNERNILGMVGTGAMQQVMILSKQQLRMGFENSSGKENTAIHEFVHLIDKTDGEVDGIPEFLMQQPFALPWIKKIHELISDIQDGHSDINPYGATNPAEFFAVVAEYFFKRPDLLEKNHPELFKMLSSIFNQQPAGHVNASGH
jgi:Mlc titration factor MtfA (ptsG expression regulator)